MAGIVCTAITALATIVCAAIAAISARNEKEIRKMDEASKQQAEERTREGRLQLAMIAANSTLTVGVAEALKKGRCNGEVEAGLAAVDKANREYEQFLEGIAIEKINGR